MAIKEIWETAGQKQRNDLLTLIVMDGVSYPTAYSWCNGTRRPKPLYQENIRKYVKDVFGVEESVEELFPRIIFVANECLRPWNLIILTPAFLQRLLK